MEQIKRYIEEGWEGRTLALYHTSIVDRMITSLLHGESSQTDFAVFALGSYGRQELCPYSDIDILIFSDDRQNAGQATDFLYSLWDKGLTLGHSFRTPKECIDEAFEDIRTRTSLLEARFVCGNPELDSLYQEEVLQKIRGRKRNEFVSVKLREIQERHQRQGNSPFLLQPDIKESRGGLRDINNALWLTSVLYKYSKFRDFAALLPDEYYKKYLKAYDFLLRLRFVVQILSGRKNDRLLFEYHEEAARMLGIRASKKFSAVERMMRYYFLKAKAVSDFSDMIYRKCGEEITRKYFNFSVKRINDFFSISKKKIIIKNDSILRKEPIRILEAFQISADTGYELSEHLAESIKRNALYIRPVHRQNRKMIEYFLSILKSGRVSRTLRDMHESGVLDRLIPEFGSLRHLMVNDYYHMYPVDEHSLLCTSRLESLDAPASGSLNYLSEIMQTVPRKEFLYLALLLHDIGKVKGKYHEAEGYKNIKRITERFLLDPDTREFVEFIVKKHILMSEIASKHDIESPDVIAFFSEQVMTEERLNALYLMTYADMASVSDSFWTPWRDALLRELYIKTRDHIRGVRINKHELMKDIEEKYGSKLDNFIKIMPEDYFISVPVRKIMSDLALYKKSIQEGFSLHVENLQDGTTEITLSMKDREGLFSDMVSVFAVRRLNIIDARLFTTSTGWVLDRVRISNWNDLWWDGMEELIKNNLKEALLHGREFTLSEQPRKSRGIESFIEVDNENRDDHTLIEVLAPDRPGLLYDITQVFSKNKINIISGRIYTEQGIANDIFHVNEDRAQLDAGSILRVLGELWLKVKQ